MPTMPASVGTSIGCHGKLASLPRTKNTVSPTPAPTESTATSGRPDILAVGADRLHEQQLDAVEVGILDGGDDVANHASYLHAALAVASYSVTSTASMMPTIAASTGVSFMPAAMRAELPLTINTVSPTPASTVSMATR